MEEGRKKKIFFRVVEPIVKMGVNFCVCEVESLVVESVEKTCGVGCMEQ